MVINDGKKRPRNIFKQAWQESNREGYVPLAHYFSQEQGMAIASCCETNESKAEKKEPNLEKEKKNPQRLSKISCVMVVFG